MLQRIRFSVESLGPRRAAIELLPKHRTYEAAADRTFDERHGTDTAGKVEPADLGIDDGVSRDAAILYLPSPLRVTNWMLDRTGVEPTTTTFVDLGCGKGRVVLAAARRPFRRVVGVEISSELAAIARANIEGYRPPPPLLAPIDVVEADVTRIDLPDGDLLVHLYHPFETPVTEIVLDRLESSRPSVTAPGDDRLPRLHRGDAAGADAVRPVPVVARGALRAVGAGSLQLAAAVDLTRCQRL